MSGASALMPRLIGLAESGAVPDLLLRMAIRRLVGQRARAEARRARSSRAFAQAMLFKARLLADRADFPKPVLDRIKAGS